MGRLGIILDVTHLSEPSFWEVMNSYEGPVWARHHNCRSLVEDPRQLSDDQIKALIDRGSVIGSAFDAWMLLLLNYGSKNLRDVLEPAISISAKGYPLLPNIVNTIKLLHLLQIQPNHS